jgi:hypothetical protein
MQDLRNANISAQGKHWLERVGPARDSLSNPDTGLEPRTAVRFVTDGRTESSQKRPTA